MIVESWQAQIPMGEAGGFQILMEIQEESTLQMNSKVQLLGNSLLLRRGQHFD